MDNIFQFGTMPRDITQLTFMDYYSRLMLMAQTVYKWNGLPNGIDEKHIERYLFNQGRCMFFKDFYNGWMVAKCSDAGYLNYYDEPTRLLPVASGSEALKATAYDVGEECTVIYNNDYGIPTARTIMLYAARLAEMQRTIDININAQKTPILIKTSDKKLMSLKAVYRQWQGNEPVIYGDRELDLSDAWDVLNTAAPVVFDKLTIEKNKLWNECMTFLGINNANMDKRERLVDDEVQANNEQIGLSAQIMLKARQRAAKQMSELCGQEITVELRATRKPAQDPAQDPNTDPEGGSEE